jgi:hypothetical protein
MSNKISFRNALAGTIFARRIDKKRFEDYDDAQVANMSLRAADAFVAEAEAYQAERDEEAVGGFAGCEEVVGGCAGCDACDEEGYMSSRPGETFGAFLKRVYADRDASLAKQAKEAPKPQSLHDIFMQFERDLDELHNRKG